MLNTLSVIFTIIVLIVVSLIFVVTYVFQNSVEQSLNSACNELSLVFPGYTADSASEFTALACDYVENFDQKERMGVMAINSSGRIVLTSTGFIPSESEEMKDFGDAKKSPDGYAYWSGRLASGEPAMSETRIISTESGVVVGAVRYIVSMEPINSRILIVDAIIVALGIVMLAMVIFSGLLFIRSIVKPIRRLSEAAAQIAQGDFSASEKIEHKYDDEIGDLCDAVSDMAKDLQTTEQMKNDFISRVSHELRTPLTAIKGWAETMQLSERGTLDRRTFDRGMGVIIKESSRLTGIVEELLDFGRIQSGRMVLINEKIDIIAEFDETVYMLKDRAAEEGIHLLYDEDDTVYYPPVYGDRNRLRQVFLNVLDNALKYTPKGGVVAAQVIYTKDDPEVIKIVVTDSGCGISAEDLPRVKEKFYKANQKVGGSGIGLAVADEIMNLHHGSLNIESGEGVGTTVTLTLPVYKEGAENMAETKNIKL
ncbi:MAG: HAMP domain-containing histidine kinase [Ruminococcus sp.]|jgi:signal transduction histidine kinase|nr:HAMP domain-containing histidine kinase [Ruminococcus sp.]MBQ1587203.1 HAMP domain-containing histidine kinase [Ruminococcus sp.]MBQ1594816.1 HAMP domain-containing histidine kinase [Ruminococcus sp.]MBQ1716893.1 HAMP domain-containing histidine kinase [Ruminococcus sp.]MBQ1921547.1 HAMP domain-containing histidine kinase [Ruminococcus sp.]